MKHLKSINEYLDPILSIPKEELGMGIENGDKLVINSEVYYFLRSVDNNIYVSDENGVEQVFNLDELNDTWTISSIDDKEIVVESKNFEVSLIDHIIAGLESGDLILDNSTNGFFITDSEGEDSEAYSILPYGDDSVATFGRDKTHFQGWYITGHTEEGEIEEDISVEDVERISEYI